MQDFAKLSVACAFIMICCRVCGNDLTPLGYSASGELRFQQVLSNGVVLYEEIWQFTLDEDAIGKWKLEIYTTFPDKSLPVSVTNIISCDKTNIYSVDYSSDIVETPIGGKPKVVPLKTESYAAVISAGCYPIDESSEVGVIWLAFLGGDYLDPDKTQTRFPNLLVPDPRRDPRAWDCDLKYSLIRSTNHWLISSGEYILQRAYIRKSAVDYPEMDEPIGERQIETFKEAFSRYKNLKSASTVTSDYHLDETTNLNGRLLPTRFHSNLGLEDKSDVSDSFICVVSNVAISATTDLMPPLRGTIRVEDRRMRFKDGRTFRKDVTYTLSRNVWPTDNNDPRMSSLTAARPPQQIIEQSSNPQKFIIVKVLFTIVLLAPLAILVVKWFRAKRN